MSAHYQCHAMRKCAPCWKCGTVYTGNADGLFLFVADHGFGDVWVCCPHCKQESDAFNVAPPAVHDWNRKQIEARRLDPA